MSIKRMTAKKVRIAVINEGEWIKKEGMEPSYIQAKDGSQISRARLLGTIVGKFAAEDGNFASVTIDDGSDTIRAKTFKTTKPIGDFEIGDMVDVIGKVREYNDEVYVIPEVVRKVDVNWELLRRLELLTKKDIPEAKEISVETADKEKLRKEVLKLIEKWKEGIMYTDLLKESSVPEEKIEPIITDLLAEGICFEPSPGRIRKI